MARNFNIAAPFCSNSSLCPEQEALCVGADRFTYRELQGKIRRLAAALRPSLTHGRVGILASRSTDACVGILATAWTGGTYVPISLKLPEARLIELFELLQLDALIVDRAGEKLLSSEVEASAPDILFRPGTSAGEFRLLPDRADVAGELAEDQPAHVGPHHIAYIEFTSGTTGKPKGVVVSTGAVASYLDAMDTWYEFRPGDRAADISALLQKPTPAAHSFRHICRHIRRKHPV